MPLIFIRPPTAAIGPDDKIVLKHLQNRADYEGELGVVIGKKAKDVPEDRNESVY
jgi:2-keto-4-pentenoate hydratase/2-oxohepta-3-ene-1,7-dioic acid hydratase in catechol pathway